MKYFFILLFFFTSLNSYSQDVSGIWLGRFTNSNLLQAELPYKYELLLFQNEQSITGYSYSTSGAADYYAVCEIKGTLFEGYMVVTEIKTLYQNPASGEGVLQSHILFFNANDQEATGDWKQTNKKVFQLFQQTGNTFLKKETDPSKSALIKILERKGAIQTESANKPATPNQDSIKLASRQKEILRTINILSDSVFLELVDDGIIDGDSVSVYLNNNNLLNKVELSTKAFKQTIFLPNTNEGTVITMFAENEGAIPPNTGLLIIRDGEIKYEIRFSSDKKKSAAVQLQRK